MPGQYYAFLFFALLGHGLLAVIVFMFVGSVGEVVWLARLPHAEVGASAGPAVFRGTVTGAAPRTTPTGVAGVGWIAWVEHSTGGKSNSTYLRCHQAELTGLGLVGAGATVGLDGFVAGASGLYREVSGVGLLGGGRPGPFVVDLGDARSEAGLTPVAQRLCDVDPAASRSGSDRYSEVSVADGATAELIGCVSTGQAVGCPGHRSYFTTRDRRAVVEHESAVLLGVLLGCSVGCVFALVGGYGGLRRLRQARPT